MTEPLPLPDNLLAVFEEMRMEELVFTPGPVKPRHDGWTPERQHAFIVRLGLCGCVAAAARSVRMSSASAYALRKHPDAGSFAAAWDKALSWGVDRIADIAIERALLGEERPVFYQGRQVGIRVHYDTSLLIAVLGRSDRAERLKADGAP